MKRIKNPRFKVVLLVVVVAALFVGLRLAGVDFSGVTEEDFKAWVESLGTWGPVTYIFVYLLRPLVFFPASILSAVAGVIWGPAVGFLYLQLAANISSTAEFLIARHFARDAVARLIKGKAQELDERIEKHGFVTVLLIRLIPNVAWDIQNVSLGITKVRFRDYFFATFIGIMPISFAFVFFGSSLIKVLFHPRNLWIAGVAVFIFVGVRFLQKYLKDKKLKG